MKSFASDNYATIHPEILKAIEKANSGHEVAYGGDNYTLELNERVKNIFGGHAEAFPVLNGTGANVASLMALLKPYEAVVCTQSAHINVDECGAAERILGVKLLDLPSADGKLTPEKLKPVTSSYGNEHQVQGKVLSLTQSTERGTLYSLAELEALRTVAQKNKMKVHIDGARFANAVAALGVSPRKIVDAAAADILCLGGTKNGLMLGEIIISLMPKFRRK